MKYMNIYNLRRVPYQRRWTKQAVECYYLGCICEKCSIPEDFKEKCHMKASVLELVRLEKEIPDNFKRERKDIINEDEKMDAKKLVEKIVKEKCWSNFKIKEIISAVEAEGGMISDVWCSEVLKSLGYVYDWTNRVWYYPMPEKKVVSSKDVLDDFAESQLKLRAATEEIDRLLAKNKELKEENINNVREYNQLYDKFVNYKKEHQELVKKYEELLEDNEALSQKNEEALETVNYWKRKTQELEDKYVPKKAPGLEVDPQIRVDWQLKDFEKHPDHELAFDLAGDLNGFCNGDLCKDEKGLCSKFGKCSEHNKFFNKPCAAVKNMYIAIESALNKYFEKVGNDWMI